MKIIKTATVQRISAAIGFAATATAIGVTLAPPAATTITDAHQKFTVVTVVATPAPTAEATVTETDKPHQLETTRATPRVRAARTISSHP